MDYQGGLWGGPPLKIYFQGRLRLSPGPGNLFSGPQKIQRFEIWIPAILFYGASSKSNLHYIVLLS